MRSLSSQVGNFSKKPARTNQHKTMIKKDLTERDPKTHAIIGAAIEVHKQLGCGFLQPVYQEALAVEFSKRQIPFHRKVTTVLTSSVSKGLLSDLRRWQDSVAPKKHR